jgi:mycofactocin glycosyltransferase
LRVIRPPLLDAVQLLERDGHGWIEPHHAELLVRRGLAHPIVKPSRATAGDITVVIPVFDDPTGLRQAILSVLGTPTIVVDDGSADPESIAEIVAGFSVGEPITLIRSEVNQGPATARNVGCAHVTTPLVAFLDADCVATQGWLEGSIPYFADHRAAVVAPRVRLQDNGARSPEWVVDALNMGPATQLVQPGSQVGFVPSAALCMRTSVARTFGFRDGQRIGEDVDLIWRLSAAGYVIRYEPHLAVEHRPRPTTRAWLSRMTTYGTSAAPLAARFPQYPRPVLPTPWSAATITALLVGRPDAALVTLAASATLLGQRLGRFSGGRAAALPLTLEVLHADIRALSALTRREWWPLLFATAAAAPSSRIARRALALMTLPLIEDYLTDRRGVDPLRYGAARIAADLAYGFGVSASVIRSAEPRPLWPRFRRSSARSV